MSSRLPFCRFPRVSVKALIAFVIQTAELGRALSSDFVTGLACMSRLALATRIPRSTTSSTPIEPPLAPSSFPRPPLLAIILGSCLQPSNRRLRVHMPILNMSFLLFIQPPHSESLHRYLPTTRLYIRITLVLPTLPSTRPADLTYQIQLSYTDHHTSHAARIRFLIACADLADFSTPCLTGLDSLLDRPRLVGRHRTSLLRSTGLWARRQDLGSRPRRVSGMGWRWREKLAKEQGILLKRSIQVGEAASNDQELESGFDD
ncbi:hypothetical protein BDV93DRAFT_564584 [Ceratobasidium sp. AG-I]|nr:hypothetical protein BDV93DRAFT_564584 [Ceratobasidium sp. AG-I]